jgi:hypothetical protein
MKLHCSIWIGTTVSLAIASLLLSGAPAQQKNVPAPTTAEPHFEAVQADLFGVSGGQPNCWADFDNDGDLDLFVGMKGNAPNKLYRNDHGSFREIAAEVGIADTIDTRGAAWAAVGGLQQRRRHRSRRGQQQSGWAERAISKRHVPRTGALFVAGAGA